MHEIAAEISAFLAAASAPGDVAPLTAARFYLPVRMRTRSTRSKVGADPL
jgi:hypothetical protein